MAEHIEYQGNFSGSQIDTLLAKIQSSQVFTTEEKTKLASLVNYDDTEVKEDISDIETSLNSHKSDKTNPHEVTKAQVGLGNVDNTSDANKPISTATQTALNNKVDKVTGKGLSTNDFTNEYKSQIEKNILLYTNRNNTTTFSFNGLSNIPDSTHFKYGILIGGGAASNSGKVMIWHVFINTSETVFFTKIIGDDTMTLTGSISDGVLTITSSVTIYGGLRLIWLG